MPPSKHERCRRASVQSTFLKRALWKPWRTNRHTQRTGICRAASTLAAATAVGRSPTWPTMTSSEADEASRRRRRRRRRGRRSLEAAQGSRAGLRVRQGARATPGKLLAPLGAAASHGPSRGRAAFCSRASEWPKRRPAWPGGGPRGRWRCCRRPAGSQRRLCPAACGGWRRRATPPAPRPPRKSTRPRSRCRRRPSRCGGRAARSSGSTSRRGRRPSGRGTGHRCVGARRPEKAVPDLRLTVAPTGRGGRCPAAGDGAGLCAARRPAVRQRAAACRCGRSGPFRACRCSTDQRRRPQRTS